jgi:hypothetical protein
MEDKRKNPINELSRSIARYYDRKYAKGIYQLFLKNDKNWEKLGKDLDITGTRAKAIFSDIFKELENKTGAEALVEEAR